VRRGGRSAGMLLRGDAVPLNGLDVRPAQPQSRTAAWSLRRGLALGCEIQQNMARRQRMIGSEKRSQQVTAVHSSSQHRI